MSRGPWKFKPSVLAKALTEARSAGARVKFSRDGFEIDFGKPADETDLDRELAEFEARHGQV